MNEEVKKEIVNHKELVPFEHYMEEYRKADPQRIVDRTKVKYRSQDQVFELHFLNRDYEITWPDYQIRAVDGKDQYSPLLETNQAKIMVIRFLLEDSTLESTGRFLTYRDVPWGEVYYRQFNGRCMKRLEFSYGVNDTKLNDFRARMERLGCTKVTGADAAYEYEIFPGYKVRFLIWEGDDEFPPSSQILFSDNFAAAFHPEDLVVVCELVINALKKI